MKNKKKTEEIEEKVDQTEIQGDQITTTTQTRSIKGDEKTKDEVLEGTQDKLEDRKDNMLTVSVQQKTTLPQPYRMSCIN